MFFQQCAVRVYFISLERRNRVGILMRFGLSGLHSSKLLFFIINWIFIKNIQCITRLQAKILFIHFATWTLSRFSINFIKISKNSNSVHTHWEIHWWGQILARGKWLQTDTVRKKVWDQIQVIQTHTVITRFLVRGKLYTVQTCTVTKIGGSARCKRHRLTLSEKRFFVSDKVYRLKLLENRKRAEASCTDWHS